MNTTLKLMYVLSKDFNDVFRIIVLSSYKFSI